MTPLTLLVLAVLCTCAQSLRHFAAPKLRMFPARKQMTLPATSSDIHTIGMDINNVGAGTVRDDLRNVAIIGERTDIVTRRDTTL
jgi:hypothetical protein